MIKTLILDNFMGYGRFETQEFASINVIIGKNDTGKTGLLKLLYAATKTLDIYSRKQQNEDVDFRKLLADKLINTFQPGKKGLGELVNKAAKEKLSVNIGFDNERLEYKEELRFSFGDSTTNTIKECPKEIKPISERFGCLFIPAKEVLTVLKAVRATRDNLHIQGFDDTYLDLIKALVVPVQKQSGNGHFKEVLKQLEELFEGQIEQQNNDDFVFKKGNSEFQVSMTAEGVKKLGILTTLIRNRQVNADTVLFFDEPETSLHPDAIRELVETMMLLAMSGIQIFIATHDYFVLKQMHLSARREKVATRCYSLEREKGKTIEYMSYDLSNDFPENTISDEAIKMSDEEVKLDLGI